MGAFSQKKVFDVFPNNLDKVSKDVIDHFTAQGYETNCKDMISGGFDLSISKSNLFKNICGMKSALKIKVLTAYDNVTVEISVGIWGQQLIPSVISMFVYWPILISQIWGLIKQSNLDDEALEIIETSLNEHCRKADNSNQEMVYCPKCGTGYPKGTKFCSNDASPL